ncbi:ABC transporter substrate-binding protein [Fusibacter ferrireducens]|uniref:NrtA/SsuA/CpmA family ABC transporter substrate-binding protein n=1 Tax=Fusibacter ferrireducens TaxID=2785058 RepID=A0ABR9ZNS4_9FIRM|nr:NrtA/SsuA/CpmA family ABC transporter substrate-binding protein [Fusibacter ferrireducens]MBF4692096.1 NrtA/SsuA/CpmA family ABC transporter substrate-binding protein [Fusibacter ferrireducens]
MRKISLIVIFTILAFATLATGCTNKASEIEAKEKVSISYVKLPLNVPSIIEKKEQLFEKAFEKEGIEVVFSEITEGSKMTEAMASGSLEFSNALGGTSAILAAANGLDVKIIGIYSRAPEAFTLMAKDSAIKEIKDLKGKKIVGPKGTILHQLLLSALAEAGLSVDDVEFINMSIGDGLVALSSDNADVALVAGPAVTKSIQSGNHVLITGKGLLDATIVIATSGKMIEQYPEIVKTYMDVHNESLAYMKNNPDKTYELVAEETGISVEEVKSMYAWYDFNPEITVHDISELKKTQAFLIENGMLEKEIEIESLIADMTH